MIESIDLAEVKGCLDSLHAFCLKPTKQNGDKLGLV